MSFWVYFCNEKRFLMIFFMVLTICFYATKLTDIFFTILYIMTTTKYLNLDKNESKFLLENIFQWIIIKIARNILYNTFNIYANL